MSSTAIISSSTEVATSEIVKGVFDDVSYAIMASTLTLMVEIFGNFFRS
jgi:hypothetical protein